MITSKSTDIGTDTSRTSGTDGVDTLPDNAAGELADAVEWLRKAGVLQERPAFANFFEEIVHTSQEGEPELE